jgi:DNA-directed RNA polymerase delta subunit
MKLKDYKKEDLQNMGYDDLAALILEDAGKKMKIADIFKKINSILELDPSEYENKIGDFFELLSTDKKFIMLDKGYWDLRSKHAPKVVIDEEDDVSGDLVEDDIDEEDEEETDIFYESDSDDDEEEDDLQDLVVVDEEDEEEQSL